MKGSGKSGPRGIPPVSELDLPSVAKLFEEIKVMYEDLPNRMNPKCQRWIKALRESVIGFTLKMPNWEMSFSERRRCHFRFLPLLTGYQSVSAKNYQWLSKDLGIHLFSRNESGDIGGPAALQSLCICFYNRKIVVSDVLKEMMMSRKHYMFFIRELRTIGE